MKSVGASHALKKPTLEYGRIRISERFFHRTDEGASAIITSDNWLRPHD
jgi:hypothetical protein